MHDMNVSPTAERMHGLDALRGFALLAGVALHATMSYLPGAQYWWFVTDTASIALSGLFFWIHQFRMPLFFLIAGLFGRLLIERIGTRAFVRDRIRRIVLPLLGGWPLLMIGFTVVIVMIGAVKYGGAAPEPPPGPKFTPDDFPLTHLWFLYVLVWFYAAMLLLRTVAARIDRDGRGAAFVDRMMRLAVRPGAALLLALPLTCALFALPVWHQWFGIPTPDQSLYPNRAALIGCGGAFAFGWLMHRQSALLLACLERHWPLQLTIAIAASAACIAITGVAPMLSAATADGSTLVYAYVYAVGGVAWSFASIGAAQRFLSGYSAARRYVADASYWIYIVHLPLILALQVGTSLLAWPWWIEYPLMLAAALALLFASYALLVRHTWIGALLNGRRAERVPQPSNRPEPAAAAR
jgi:glucan biosynthesis protein C